MTEATMTFADKGIHGVSGSGETRTTCPECSHTRKKKNDKCLSVNVAEGIWHCHHCEWAGSLGNGNSFSHANITYEYCDERGKVLYQKIRAYPKKFWQQTPDGEKLNGVRRVPYRLRELIESEGAVYLCEGEKDCDTLFKHGLTATCNHSGAGNWKPELNEFLKDRNVVIFEDNDDPGKKHGRVVAESLYGIAANIKIVRFEELKTGGDVTDYLDSHSMDDLMARQMQAPLFTGSYSEYFPSPGIVSQIETWNQIRSMDIKVEWLMDRIIPKESITVLFGKGGIGKTWLVMDIARCIGGGVDYLGHETQNTPVCFIDFENPVAVLNTRTQKLGEADNVYFWRVGNELKPPKLDSNEWVLYKDLPQGALLVFDTLRASHGRDENASDQMAGVMERVKELRDCGFTIILLHHTPKNSDKISKGSTAIVDLADHILNLSRVRKAKDGEDVLVHDDDDDDEAIYRFGVREKTRFEPHHIYLVLNPDRGFELAPDPEEETFKSMRRVLEDSGQLQKTEFAKQCKSLSLGEKKARRLIDRGIGRFWKIEDTGKKNAQLVVAIQFGSLAPPIGSAELPNYIEAPNPENGWAKVYPAEGGAFWEKDGKTVPFQ